MGERIKMIKWRRFREYRWRWGRGWGLGSMLDDLKTLKTDKRFQKEPEVNPFSFNGVSALGDPEGKVGTPPSRGGPEQIGTTKTVEVTRGTGDRGGRCRR